MNDEVKRRLIEIASRDRELLREPRRLKAMLMDLCGEHRKEINLLTMAHQEGIAEAMQNPAAAGNVRQIWSKQLQNNLGMTEEAAEWTVEAWAEALGLPPKASSVPVQPSASAQARPGPAAIVASSVSPQPVSVSAVPSSSAAQAKTALFRSRKGIIAIASILVLAVCIWIWAAQQQATSSAEPEASTPPPSATASAESLPSQTSAAAPVSAAAPAFTEPDFHAYYPERYLTGSKSMKFDETAYEIVLGADAGEEAGDWSGRLYVSVFQYDPVQAKWRELSVSDELATEYEPSEDSSVIGSFFDLQPNGGKLGAVVFEILTSGSSGVNSIYAMTIDENGGTQWMHEADDDTIDYGWLPEGQVDEAVVTASSDGGQLRMEIVDGEFSKSRKPRSEVYPPDAMKIPIKLGNDGLVRVVGEDRIAMKVGETFVFSPADEATKAMFDDPSRLGIYTDETLANFSYQWNSYDTMGEAGVRQYFLNGDNGPTLTIEVSESGSATETKADPAVGAAIEPSKGESAEMLPAVTAVVDSANPVPSADVTPTSSATPTSELTPEKLAELDKKLMAAINKSICCSLTKTDRQKIVELLDAGADPNYPDKNGWTPLHSAAFSARAQIVQLLIDYGGDVTLLMDDGDSAIDITENVWTIKVLVGAGMDINEKDSIGMSRLYHAVLGERVSDVKALLEMGADPNTASDISTALDIAAKNPEIYQMLIEAGADETASQ